MDVDAVSLPVRERRDEDVPELLVARELACDKQRPAATLQVVPVGR